MRKVRVQGFVVTSQPVEAYGGVRIPEEEIESLAEALNELDGGFVGHHDERLALPSSRLLTSEVRRTEDGYLGIWVDIEVDGEEWARMGEVRAWSIALVQPQDRPDPQSPKPLIALSVDAAHFDQEMLAGAVRELRREFEVGSGRLYQFSEVPPPKVILDLGQVLLDIGIGVAAAAIFDGLRHLLRPKRAGRSIFIFKVHVKGKLVSGRLETDNEEVLRTAIEQLPSIEKDETEASGFEFDQQQNGWKGYL